MKQKTRNALKILTAIFAAMYFGVNTLNPLHVDFDITDHFIRAQVIYILIRLFLFFNRNAQEAEYQPKLWKKLLVYAVEYAVCILLGVIADGWLTFTSVEWAISFFIIISIVLPSNKVIGWFYKGKDRTIIQSILVPINNNEDNEILFDSEEIKL